MADLGRGVVAGFIATIAISLFMLMRLASGIMTEFQPIEIMNLNAQNLFGTPSSDLVGWVIHFVVGSVIWGVLFALLAPRLPGGSYSGRGLVFGVGAWLVVMLTIFPLAGSGFFGLGFGVIVAIITLIAHLLFGLVLGASYGWLKRV